MNGIIKNGEFFIEVNNIDECREGIEWLAGMGYEPIVGTLEEWLSETWEDIQLYGMDSSQLFLCGTYNSILERYEMFYTNLKFWEVWDNFIKKFEKPLDNYTEI